MYVKHEPCPRCGSKDNLGVYKDGHKWCFGCRYYVPPTDTLEGRVARFRPLTEDINYEATITPIPIDASTLLSQRSLEWIKGYGISDAELEQHRILYSEEKDQLIFPIYGESGIVAWQARNFNPERLAKGKYYSVGNFDSIEVQFGDFDNEEIVLTEDYISALKVSRHTNASPIFGAHISNNRLNRFIRRFKYLAVWLDYDKAVEARKATLRALQHGFEARSIHTQLDPKELSDKDIQRYLERI